MEKNNLIKEVNRIIDKVKNGLERNIGNKNPSYEGTISKSHFGSTEVSKEIVRLIKLELETEGYYVRVLKKIIREYSTGEILWEYRLVIYHPDFSDIYHKEDFPKVSGLFKKMKEGSARSHLASNFRYSNYIPTDQRNKSEQKPSDTKMMTMEEVILTENNDLITGEKLKLAEEYLKKKKKKASNNSMLELQKSAPILIDSPKTENSVIKDLERICDICKEKGFDFDKLVKIVSHKQRTKQKIDVEPYKNN